MGDRARCFRRAPGVFPPGDTGDRAGPAAAGNVPDVRIVVCVKHVPDIQSDRALGPDHRVVRDGGDGTLNELDENALEAALALVEAAGG